MTHQQILKKAINKAIENGWKYDGGYHYKNFKSFNGIWVVIELKETTLIANEQDELKTVNMITSKILEKVIFNHDFAKALWGEELFKFRNNSPFFPRLATDDFTGAKPLYQYHLQQMVIAKDPIKYLGGTI